MRLALIPPISLLPLALSTGYQLVLPQLMYDPCYREFYSYLCKDPNQYVILDNGAAEGATTGNQHLLNLIEQYQPDEVVLPDVLGNGPATVELVRAFMKDISGGVPNCKLGFVAQGQTYDQALRTVLDVLEDFGDEIDVVYVPRLLVSRKEPHARLYVASDIRYVCEKEIHFLGASSSWVMEALYAAESTIVRGIDTSAPFNYAYYHAWVGNKDSRFDRPPSYFTRPSTLFDPIHLNRNIQTLKEWTGADFSARV